MLTQVCQRWRDRRGAYRPAGETISTRLYEVAKLDRLTAKAFVLQHHYSGSFPAARFCAGLYRTGELVGVAALSVPASQAALEAALPFGGGEGRTELGRFVLRDDVEANGESWFLARLWDLARAEGFTAVVAHSDPAARFVGQKRVFAGHVGTIYQATNATYVGRTMRRTVRMYADGTVLSDRALSKLRVKDRGWERVAEQLVAHGAPAPSGDHRAWVKLATDAVSTPVRHPGNHRYVWALDKTLKKRLPDSLAYPKVALPVVAR